MNKTILLISILCIISLTSLVISGEKDNEICDYLSNDLGLTTGIALPNNIPYSNEIFNIYTKENYPVGHIEIKEKKVISFDCQVKNESTFNVYIKDKKTINDIFSSNNSISELNKKIKSNDLEIKGASFGKKFKGAFTRLGLKIAGWFS